MVIHPPPNVRPGQLRYTQGLFGGPYIMLITRPATADEQMRHWGVLSTDSAVTAENGWFVMCRGRMLVMTESFLSTLPIV